MIKHELSIWLVLFLKLWQMSQFRVTSWDRWKNSSGYFAIWESKILWRYQLYSLGSLLAWVISYNLYEVFANSLLRCLYVCNFIIKRDERSEQIFFATLQKYEKVLADKLEFVKCITRLICILQNLRVGARNVILRLT